MRSERVSSVTCSHLRGRIGRSSHVPRGPDPCQARDWAEGVTSYGTLRRAQTFARRRSTSGLPSEAPKLSAPAAKTFAPAGVS